MILVAFLYVGVLVFSFLGIFYGIVVVLNGFKRYRQAVLIADTPASKLDSVATGPAAVSGTVEPTRRPLVVPIVERPCVAYELTVSDAGAGSTRTPCEERRHLSFALRDETDTVRVTADAVADADVDLTLDRQRELEVKSFEESPAPVARFERDRNLPSRGMTFDRTYELSWIEPGDEIYVYGRVEPDTTAATPDGNRPADYHAKKRVAAGADAPEPFLSNKVPEAILTERKYGLAKALAKGIVVAAVSLPVFLFVSGIAPVFLAG
ncbi:hypothetical protein Halru_2477 [Halovivax ruber XH-70]|uniref:RING-type E3 ubiquitin transferase n=1 Tax=Halovivax ruber (strain DSM 18193 / JCM 13892 / XH-70) TaxID=797302 RepID=L0IE61_HALRX|nr:hypothetical protein [Halovivax ruber]AGB17059.1 hypothetical protein Halru_2477 [Halovivax ruber XH-70]